MVYCYSISRGLWFCYSMKMLIFSFSAASPFFTCRSGSKKAVPQAPMFNQRHAGKIKWFDNQRGFGFITPDAGGVELYVHCTYLKSDGVVHLMPGTRVEYESIPSFDGKMQAINVTAPNNRLLQDCRKRALPDLSTLIGKNTGSSPSHISGNRGCLGPGLGPCFYCGKWGHISKECPVALQRGTGSYQKPSDKSDELEAGVYQKPRDKSDELEPGEGWSVLWCYICQNAGHVPNNCVWKRP